MHASPLPGKNSYLNSTAKDKLGVVGDLEFVNAKNDIMYSINVKSLLTNVPSY